MVGGGKHPGQLGYGEAEMGCTLAYVLEGGSAGDVAEGLRCLLWNWEVTGSRPGWVVWRDR